jgi:hypothetical protein
MPNHVHLLVCLLGNTDLEEQCYSWKKYTATSINRALGQKGRFWQEESFDHLVRSPEQFHYLRRLHRCESQESRLARKRVPALATPRVGRTLRVRWFGTVGRTLHVRRFGTRSVPPTMELHATYGQIAAGIAIAADW